MGESFQELCPENEEVSWLEDSGISSGVRASSSIDAGRGSDGSRAVNPCVPPEEEAGLLLWPAAVEEMELWSLDFTAESFIPRVSPPAEASRTVKTFHDFPVKSNLGGVCPAIKGERGVWNEVRMTPGSNSHQMSMFTSKSEPLTCAAACLSMRAQPTWMFLVLTEALEEDSFFSFLGPPRLCPSAACFSPGTSPKRVECLLCRIWSPSTLEQQYMEDGAASC
jgi:hypothetical protein